MNASRFLVFGLLCAALAAQAHAADEPAPPPEPAPKTHMRDLLRAKIAEDAKKQAAAQPTPPTAPGKSEDPASTATPASTSSAPAATTTTPAPQPPKKPADQPATVMPKVEVKKDRITVLDQKLAKQDEEIAREKKNTKSTELDTALNDSKIAKPLAIFGGDSAQFRKRVSSERVEMMEEEKDIIEAMARVKTKKEKEELQKQLDELRAMRRELEKALR